MKNLFHLAFPVSDLDAAREFYGGVLGCPEGRSSEHWIDFDLYGHQIVTHLSATGAGVKSANHVDADDVPVPHFGIVLPMEEWKELAERLKQKGVEFTSEISNQGWGMLISLKVPHAGEMGLYQPRHPTAYDL